MPFETAVTIKEVLEKIEKRDFLLPAIQREFVWSQDQVLTLIDSLMRGYPIGSFLLWEVGAESVGKYTYYNFISDFKEKAPFADKAPVLPGKSLTAVLDGQQRLTALNIALKGSFTQKKKGAWANSTDSQITKRAYLNLSDEPKHEELGFAFDLRFLTDAEANELNKEINKWFLLNKVFDLTDAGPAIVDEITSRNVDFKEGYGRLHRLHEAIVTSLSINWYLEKSQDADKVLDIFVRVNSGGTTLSYSDLLLSMATNQWETKDAREEVRSVVNELNNSSGRDFSFTKDNVLKSALMISDLPVRFAVSSFTRENMEIVEKNWEKTRKSLLNASDLLRSFGFTRHNLPAHTVVSVLAHYLSKVDNQDTFVQSSKYADDRRLIKLWVVRTLLKQGIWGSGLDTLLNKIRVVINENTSGIFPLENLYAAMSSIGKSLNFEESEMDDILNAKYGSAKTFGVLSLLYPGLDFTAQFHQDHIFPKSLFTEKALAKAGITDSKAEDFKDKYDLLPNLQLLKGQQNIEKQAQLPKDWFETSGMSSEQLSNYLLDNDLDGLPMDFTDFGEFFAQRRARMTQRLKEILATP